MSETKIRLSVYVDPVREFFLGAAEGKKRLPIYREQARCEVDDEFLKLGMNNRDTQISDNCFIFYATEEVMGASGETVFRQNQRYLAEWASGIDAYKKSQVAAAYFHLQRAQALMPTNPCVVKALHKLAVETGHDDYAASLEYDAGLFESDHQCHFMDPSLSRDDFVMMIGKKLGLSPVRIDVLEKKLRGSIWKQRQGLSEIVTDKMKNPAKAGKEGF